jgi:hypothetical protein
VRLPILAGRLRGRYLGGDVERTAEVLALPRG